MNGPQNDDDILTSLRALPARQPPAAAAARIHRRARARFVERAAERAHPRLRLLLRFYDSAELALAAAVTIVYLGWAASTAAQLLGK